MIRSMTAFARQTFKKDWGTVYWELKSVNQRFLETQYRLPEALRYCEAILRDCLRKRLSRGKVDVFLKIDMSADEGSELKVNQALVKQLSQAYLKIQELTDKDEQQSLPLSVLMKWPGVLESSEMNTSMMEKDLLESFEQTLSDLIAVREREGTAISEMLEIRLNKIQEQVDYVQQQMPDILTWQKQRLDERLKDIRENCDTDRLEQEMAILAQKIDVDEEMDRLKTHCQEVSRLLQSGGVIGRRLDFLMQELNREANTLGSKSISTVTTKASVEIKVLIEQMREQIQNIE